MALQQQTDSEAGGASMTEAKLHFIFAEIFSRLQLFAQALALCPQLVTMMVAAQNQNNMFTTAREMVKIEGPMVVLLSLCFCYEVYGYGLYSLCMAWWMFLLHVLACMELIAVVVRVDHRRPSAVHAAGDAGSRQSDNE